MNQQSGHHRVKSQVKKTSNSKLEKSWHQRHTKQPSVTNDSRKVHSEEGVLSKLGKDDGHHARYYDTDQPTKSVESVLRKSKEFNLGQAIRKSKYSVNTKHLSSNLSKQNTVVSSNSESKHSVNLTAIKRSEFTKEVKNSDKNGIPSNHKNNNMLSSVEFYHEKQQDSANYQINKPKEMCDTFVDQTIPEEIHPKNESDDYSSDFSETHSSVSLDALTPELTKPYSAYKPNSVTPKLSAGTEIHDTENCEYVSTGQRVRCALLIDQITDRSDKKNNNVIRFKQSDNLLFHQHVHSRVKRRANDLFKLIDLSLDQLINVFELKPIDCYEFLMPRSNEYRNRIHRQVQTNDDALDREVQTEPIDVCHGVWTQQPANENGDFYGRDSSNNYFPSKIPYDLTDDASMKTVLGELTREFCLGTNTCSAVIEDTNNIANILFADESKLSTNYNFKNSNNCSQLPDSFSEYLYLMLDILNEENLASTTYLFKNCSKNDNEFESDGSDYVEILFHSTVSPFSYETDDDSQKIPSTTAVPNGDFNSVNVGETYKPNNASSFWENYECVACECAPQNQSVILTIHRPVKLSQGHELEHCFNSSTRAGEFICIWTAIGSKHLPDRLLYCPGLSETGLKGSNLNCAIFSPDKDASLVIAGLCNGSLSIWDLHNYSSEILMKPTNFVIYDDNNQCRFGSINGFKNSGLPVAFPPTYITSAVEVTDFATMKDSKSVDNFYIKQFSHFNPIISIKIADFNQQLEYSSGVIEITKNVDRFQFVALDDVGNLSLWLVLMNRGCKLQNSIDVLVGSQTDYGLSPGKGWIRLIRLLFIENKLTHHVPTYLNENPSKYRADKQTNESSNKTIATCLAVARHGTFLIGCSNGKIVHRRRSSSQIVYPKLFSRILCCAAVQTIAVHPNESLHLFLAGYADGKICLYKTNYFQPILEWDVMLSPSLFKLTTSSQQGDTSVPNLESTSTDSCSPILVGVRKLIWLDTRSSIFFSLDSYDQILIWNTVHIYNAKSNPVLINRANFNVNSHNEMKTSVNDNSMLLSKINDICLGALQGMKWTSTFSPSSTRPKLNQSPCSIVLIFPHKINLYWITSLRMNELVDEISSLLKMVNSCNEFT